MKNPEMVTLFTALAITANTVFAISDEFPVGDCSINGQMCEIHDNVVTFVTGVLSLAECETICQDELECEFLTYFGANSNPFSNTCIIFSSCDILDDCHDCLTENRSPCLPLTELCSAPFEIHLGENLLQIVADIENEYDCKAECSQTVGCKFYTYHNKLDPSFPGTCFLLTSLLNPILPCENCMTGSYNCYNDEACFFTMEDGNTTNGMLITDTSTPTALMPVALGLCELTLVAVGGGGRGNYGGGGSGYIEWTKLNMTGILQIEVTVGNRKGDSVITKDGQVIVVAKPGENASDKGGGADGYSGGGGYAGGGDGGSNGGNGVDGSSFVGGKGTNVNVAGIPVKSFVLTPGVGGKATYYGGGGGGLLVDGKGPDGGTEHDGEGYGGGIGNGDGSNTLPGVVIVSFN